jgi:hypothetical protein
MVTQGFGNGFNIAGSPINPIQAVAPGDIWRRMVASSPWGMNPLARGAAEAQRPMLETQYALQQPGINMPDAMLGKNPYSQFLQGNLYGTDFDPEGKATGRFTGQLRGEQLMNRLRQIADITSPLEGGGPRPARSPMEMALQQTFENPEAQLQAAQLPALQRAAPAARGSIQRGYQRLFDQFMGQNPMGNFLAASLDPESGAYQPMVGNLENIPTYKKAEGSQVVGSNAAKGDATVVVNPDTGVTIKSEIVGSKSSMDSTSVAISTAIKEGDNPFSGFLTSIDETGDSGSKYLKRFGDPSQAAEGISTIGNQYTTVDPGFIADHDQDTFNVIDNDPRMSQEEKDLMKKSIYDANIPKEMEWVAAPGGGANGYMRAEDWFTLLGMADRGQAAQTQFLSEIPIIYPAEYALMMKQHGSPQGRFEKLPSLNYQASNMGSFGLKTTWLPDRLRAFKASRFDQPEPGFFRA